MSLDCTYQTPRPTKKDQSMAVAINAIRRLETKVEELTAAITTTPTALIAPATDHRSPISTCSHSESPSSPLARRDCGSVHGAGASPRADGTLVKSTYPIPNTFGKVNISFSQHYVSLWPAIKQSLPPEFVSARNDLPKDYIVDIESARPHLPMDIHMSYLTSGYSDNWLPDLPLSVIKGLSDAYFAVFHRNTPVLDKFHFFSNTLGMAMEDDFGYDIETCLVLNVLALGCLAVKTHQEGNFSLPTRVPALDAGFVRPEWYELVLDDPPGLKFFNEARKRFGFLMCQNDLQTGQFYMLSTLYYAQILRPIDSWTTVNRAALCCMGVLTRTEIIDFDDWEGDMFSRLFWNTLMYETIIVQELSLPLSGLLDYEADIPIPKFMAFSRPKTSISGLLVDDDDSFFNFHFLAQAAHRIILTRIRHNLYSFVEKKGYPSPTLTVEMHHQLEQWRNNLPPSLQFSDSDTTDHSPSPAHVMAKAMLRSRYLVAKFHIGRPFLYKALHAPAHTTESEYSEIRAGFRGGMYWPTTMGPCTQMLSALPIKFGWCSQCFGLILMFHAVARSPNPKLRETLPAGWQQWVQIMVALIEDCGKYSPGIAKDAELLRLL
ncbi:hypothetical protein BDV95DRAFT_626165 [Massariosphaeria phaeospora]|uniref:Xylanolytic transcriptional activator regulatory domain-containing protein n=1 Tax=Massariosphaeria phaeospora TaxID=100035 RepID=A0A7C8IGB8_9PLEO|nr:hypothetical protein BDV95DRAFT_626165 [Massariosphaeria phaeospora]